MWENFEANKLGEGTKHFDFKSKLFGDSSIKFNTKKLPNKLKGSYGDCNFEKKRVLRLYGGDYKMEEFLWKESKLLPCEPFFWGQISQYCACNFGCIEAINLDDA